MKLTTQKEGHSTFAWGVVQKFGAAATSRRQASVLTSLHETAAVDVTPRTERVKNRLERHCVNKSSNKNKIKD